tara:strand:+ start:305 stop:1843 length:1539 start_codon:yes stop_codon:yes gene_type:complete
MNIKNQHSPQNLNENQYVQLTQKPMALVESLKSLAYTPPNAFCDIIDNSIKASSNNIWIECLPDQSSISIRDDGDGMTEKELIDAMSIFNIDPRDPRSKDDLGRFGLGMKTASLSICNKFTVASKSKQDLNSSALIFDVDDIEKNQYKFSYLTALNYNPLYVKDFTKVDNHGTVVLWENLHIPGLDQNNNSSDVFTELLHTAKNYISLVFHRYIEGIDAKKIQIFWNNELIKPFNPFYPEKSQNHGTNTYQIKDDDGNLIGKMTLEGYTLPAQSQMTKNNWDYYSGPSHDALIESYSVNQGFYVYRQKRLIAYGSKVRNWFGLQKPETKFQLSRVKVDFDNDLDKEWGIELKKSELQPTDKIIPYLRTMLRPSTQGSRTKFTRQSTELIELNPLPIWKRRLEDDETRFYLDRESEIFKNFRISAEKYQLTDSFENILRLIELDLPYSLFTNLQDESHIRSREELLDLGRGWLKSVPSNYHESIYASLKIRFLRDTDESITDGLLGILKSEFE